jgi:hypothetical protein
MTAYEKAKLEIAVVEDVLKQHSGLSGITEQGWYNYPGL